MIYQMMQPIGSAIYVTCMSLPFNKLDDFEFQSVIPKFSIGELKLKVQSVEDLYNYKSFYIK